MVGATGVLENSIIEVVFDRPLDPTSLGQVTLSSNGTPVQASASLAWGNAAVRVTPSALLAANASYTVTVAGVKDLSDNVLANPYVFAFNAGGTTGSSSTQLVSTSVLVGGVSTPLTNNGLSNVDVGTTIQLVFSQAIDPASFTYGSGVSLNDVSINDSNEQLVPFSLTTVSPDQTTVTLTPNNNLAPTSQFQLRINYGNGSIYDVIGNPITNGAYYNFTTGTASSATGAPLPIYSTGLGAGGTIQLAGGASDPNWSVNNPNSCCVYSGPATALSAGNIYSSWPPDTANSQWIAWSDTNDGGPAGYTFTQTFDLSGFDPATAALQGTIWVDDGAYMYLNNEPVVYADNSTWSLSGQPGMPFSIGPHSTLFLPGTNTLTVVITNSDSNYEGINVLITSATAAPKTSQVTKSQKAIYASANPPARADRRHIGPPSNPWLLRPWDVGFGFDDFSLFTLSISGLPQQRDSVSPISLNLRPRDLGPADLSPQDPELPPPYHSGQVNEVLFASRNEFASERTR